MQTMIQFPVQDVKPPPHTKINIGYKPGNNVTTFLPSSASPVKHYKPKQTSKLRRIQASDPVRSTADLEQIKTALLKSGRHGHRNWMIWVLGTNDGERAGDYLSLRISDVWDGQQIRSIIPIRQQKTSNSTSIILSTPVQAAMLNYIQSMGNIKPDDYLFPSQKSQKTVKEKVTDNNGIPIRDENGKFVFESVKYDSEPYLLTCTYGRILKKIQEQLGLTYRVRTHSMRKTQGYHLYMKAKRDQDSPYDPLTTVKKKLGHTGSRDTIGYIGIDQDVMVKYANELVL